MKNLKTFDLPIVTYAVNLKHRTDRKKHIINEIYGKEEFMLTVLEAERHPIGAFGLWLNIKKIISIANSDEHQMVLICEDDHQFTHNYDKNNFLKKINYCIQEEVD